MTGRSLSSIVAAALATAAAFGSAAPQPGPAGALEQQHILRRYVTRPQESFGFHVRDGGRHREADWVELSLTSQVWRENRWRHQLFIIRPGNIRPGAQQALLFIDGGRWRAEYERPPQDHKLPKRSSLYLEIANRLASPVAVLRQVPNQPLFGDLTEDALIAYTFEQYLQTGDPDWPLLLPMVKSAVAAMDAVQRYAADQWSLEVTGFTVTGASKRGWTTWLAAAADERVRAIAPMVFDVLNMAPQMEHQRESWGTLSEQIADYSSRDLTERFGTAAGDRLAAIVDPFSYRQRITQPKIVILATNDRYWPVDSARLYWEELSGTRYPMYVPNQGHELTDTRRIIAALDAVHEHGARGRALPDLDWQWQEDEERLALTVRAMPAPASVRAWIARSDSRDFRNSRWRAVRMAARKGEYVYSLRKPTDGYVALYAEAIFGRGSDEIFLSTLPGIARSGAASAY
jgi:PhoPQ-activated pathogenicity-related protein